MIELEGICALVGIDYDVLTEADVAMIRKQMQAGGVEIDFSEFYIEERDDT